MTVPIDDGVTRALLDLRTDWHFWGVVEHRDERLFAGRIGDLRMFGGVMSRIDVPSEAGTLTYGIAGDLVAGWLMTSEEEARAWATIIGSPDDRSVRLDDVRSRLAIGGVHGRQ